MTARFLVGDVHDRLRDIPDASVDIVLTSPPFLALRSYLPEDHPDKSREIGSEATPAEFIDVLLELTAAWGRVLAPHGSIAVELGDTYAGSGGAGGDYAEDGLREGQPKFRMDWSKSGLLPKSLACIPALYQVALAYGRNLLRAPLSAREMLDTAEQWAEDTPELTVPELLGMMRQWIENYEEIGPYREYERWRVRTLKPWIRSNPPVGALGDKERPATSYVIVACRATDRWFDLDAVRTAPTKTNHDGRMYTDPISRNDGGEGVSRYTSEHAGGAPPRDWWHHVDAVLQAELDIRAERYNGGLTERVGLAGASRGISGGDADNPDKERDSGARTVGAQGYHLRRALERAGIFTTLEALDVSPKGYSGAHYAVWPPELVRLLVDEMCPQRVCTVCGEPSRRLVQVAPGAGGLHQANDGGTSTRGGHPNGHRSQMGERQATTVGWSDCGHGTWRPGHVLDPFAGSGTTLAVAQGMGRTATGIDIDERNAWLARERVGMFLEVDERPIVDVVDSL